MPTGRIGRTVPLAGHAGHAMSGLLGEAGREHVVVDGRDRLGGGWQDRWDEFTLVTPNWTTSFPGWAYDGTDPDGPMGRDEITARVARYADVVGASVALGTEVERLTPLGDGGFRATTSRGRLTARQVVVATGSYHAPRIPPLAEHVSDRVVQLHSHDYRNEAGLPAGAVLIVGSGQTGLHLAEEALRHRTLGVRRRRVRRPDASSLSRARHLHLARGAHAPRRHPWRDRPQPRTRRQLLRRALSRDDRHLHRARRHRRSARRSDRGRRPAAGPDRAGHRPRGRRQRAGRRAAAPRARLPWATADFPGPSSATASTPTPWSRPWREAGSRRRTGARRPRPPRCEPSAPGCPSRRTPPRRCSTPRTGTTRPGRGAGVSTSTTTAATTSSARPTSTSRPSSAARSRTPPPSPSPHHRRSAPDTPANLRPVTGEMARWGSRRVRHRTSRRSRMSRGER